ncbi:MAG TPA: hypothetical protein VFH69_02050, partial [Gemmatimonadota bacterium]|nr:hypothetical protein [Gemmatimonadota bacterium]
SLVALDAGRQLAAHLRGALHVGVPPEVLVRAVREVAGEWGKTEEVDALLAALDSGKGEGPA